MKFNGWTNGRKIVSLWLTMIMICSSCLALVGTATAQEPADVPTEDDGVPDLQVTELRASTPVIYLAQKNRLVLSLVNLGMADAKKVVVNITDIIPEGRDQNSTEILIKSVHFGDIHIEKEKQRFIDWYPDVLGVHYIKVEIRYEYLTHSSPAEVVEGPPVVLSVGFPVSPLADIKYWGPDPWDDASNIITSAEGTSTVDGPIEIRVRNGDLKIESGASLILNNDVLLVMTQDVTYPVPTYKIDIQPDATFQINGGAKTTTLQSPSSNPDFTYSFLNSGTVDFTGATVWYTYGPSDTSLAGGIQNMGGSTCIIDNCDLLEADTHSLYIDGADVSVHVMGADTIIGRDDSNPNPDVTKGHGIFVNGASPVIEDIRVKYNKMDGIHIENSNAEGAVMAPYLEYYSAATNDYQSIVHIASAGT